MVEIEVLRKLIHSGFKAWWETQVIVPFSAGGFGYLELGSAEEAQKRVAGLELAKDDKRNNCSTFLASEADLQMHFGAFLFNHLRLARRYYEQLPRYSVHLEMGSYEDRRSKADIVVFEVNSAYCHGETDFWKSARAIIEIKNENLVKRDTYFITKVVKDIEKFAKVNRSKALNQTELLYFMMVLDEDPAKGAMLEKEIRKALELSKSDSEFDFLIPTWEPKIQAVTDHPAS